MSYNDTNIYICLHPILYFFELGIVELAVLHQGWRGATYPNTRVAVTWHGKMKLEAFIDMNNKVKQGSQVIRMYMISEWEERKSNE
jgi:hypothetical protein